MINKKGFTLIELLVVIAIIGILSSVVLSSLNSARNKGANATVKANLLSVRQQAVIVYDDNFQSYATLCSDPNVIAALNQAIQVGNDVGATVATRCNADNESWAVNVALKVPENGGADVYWCTDSESKGKGETNELAGATVCP